jgi:hypothetical protein
MYSSKSICILYHQNVHHRVELGSSGNCTESWKRGWLRYYTYIYIYIPRVIFFWYIKKRIWDLLFQSLAYIAYLLSLHLDSYCSQPSLLAEMSTLLICPCPEQIIRRQQKCHSLEIHVPRDQYVQELTRNNKISRQNGHRNKTSNLQISTHNSLHCFVLFRAYNIKNHCPLQHGTCCGGHVDKSQYILNDAATDDEGGSISSRAVCK